LHLVDVPQHIIQRGSNRQATFFAEEDYRSSVTIRARLHFLANVRILEGQTTVSAE